MRIRSRNNYYETNPYNKKFPIYYYKWPLTTPKQILDKIENERNILRKRVGLIIEDLPKIEEKRNRKRYNETKTYSNKDRERFYGISQGKKRNNSYHATSYNNWGISFKDRANYLYNNYAKIKFGISLLNRKHIKIYKGKLNSSAQRVKQNINKNYKFSLKQNYCSICLDKFLEKDNITYLPCLHLFHEDCIFSWLKKKKDCPVCKINIFKFFDNFE